MITSNKLFLSRAESRELDHKAIHEWGIPASVLMENAGRSVAEVLISQSVRGPVTICCGKGNNGGDGFVIARHLDIKHIPVRIIVFASIEDLKGEAKINYDILHHAQIPIIHNLTGESLANELGNSEWIVDAIFGTGLNTEVKSPFDNIISIVNRSHSRILAVDVPSGLDCDTGLSLGQAIEADQTVTFVALKKGFTHPGARSFLGNITVVDIGIPRFLIQQFERDKEK